MLLLTTLVVLVTILYWGWLGLPLTNANGRAQTRVLALPYRQCTGRAQHEVLRCRTGTVRSRDTLIAWAVPDQRCAASPTLALHRIRDSRTKSPVQGQRRETAKRTGTLCAKSGRYRVNHGTICGRSCANSGLYKPLCVCVDRTFVNPNSARRPTGFFPPLGEDGDRALR